MIEPRRLVAIVDDDPSVRRGLKRLLQTLQWDVCLYGSAEEFLERNQADQVDLALVDLYLPGMNGVELFQRLQSTRVSPAIIFMTAHGENETMDILRAAGRMVCLRKPFSLQQLLEAASIYKWMTPDS